MGMPLIREIKQIVPELNIELQLMIAYTPDAIWLEEKVGEGMPLADAVVSSLEREPVVRHSPNTEVLIQKEIRIEGQVVADDIFGRIYIRVATADDGTSCYEYGFSLADSPSSVQWGYYDIEAVTEARRNAYDDNDQS